MNAVQDLGPELLAGMPLPQPGEGGKEARGRVFVVAGSLEVPGAALLAGEGALRAGAGKLQIAAPRGSALALGLAVPEALVMGLPESAAGGVAATAADLLCERAERCRAVLIGPGMVEEDELVPLTAALLERTREPAMLLDAAALCRLRDLREALARKGGRVVITPHAGEMATLLGISRDDVEADALGTARHAASLLQVVVALKGASTHIVTPAGEAWLYEGGGIGLATSGSGDVLAGCIVGLMARGADPVAATLWGVYLHGEAGKRLAGRHGPLGFLARELLPEIPPVMAGLSPRPA